jgi:hypothetical protein
MKVLLLFLFIGIIGVECTIYYVIPSEFTGNNHENKREIFIIFFGLVTAYFMVWSWCVCKNTYAKYNHETQWSKFMNVLFAFIFQIIWYIILSYIRYRITIILSAITSCVVFFTPLFALIEIPIFKVKIFFLIVTLIQIGIILWISIEFIIYEKIITYSWIIAYYFYPIYLATFAALFVRFLRLEEVPP